jgi:hypothetical protein
VPQGNDAAEVEIEWQIRQALPTCDELGNPLPANNSMLLEKDLNETSNALTRRYEFYKYTGVYDPETNEALPISDSPPNATDLGDYIGSQMAAANLVMPLTVFSGTLPQGEAGVAYSQILVTGGLDPYNISIFGSNLPDGLTVNVATGEITGIPTTATAQPSLFSLSVVDTNGAVATGDISLEIALPLSIETHSLPSGEVDVSYVTQVIASGGVLPFTWSVNGSLPSGLVLDSTTGVISGVPKKLSDVGIRTLVVTVTDFLLHSFQATLSLNIVPPPSIATTSLPPSEKGVVFSTVLAAINGIPPLSWSVAGLPSGLSLNSASGEISGSPSVSGTYSLTVTVTDINQKASTKSLTLTVANYISISTSSLPNGVVGTTYSSVIATSGGVNPMTWSSTALPSGLSLNAATGALTGKPTVSGSYSVTFTAQDALQQKSLKPLTLQILDPVVITTSSLPNGAIGKTYSATLTASGGALPFTWSIIGTLPQGITLDPIAGVLSGSPTQFGSFTSLKVTVMDANLLSSTKTMQLTVVSPVSISTSSLTTGTSGSAYSSKLTASGGSSPYTWAITSGTLPSGLSLEPSTATVSGTPTLTGSFNLTFSVQDILAQTATKSLILLVVPPLSITTSLLPIGAIGLSYSATLTVTGGVAPFTWVASPLPPSGLLLDSATGIVSGIPSASGSYTITFKVTDSQQRQTEKDLIISVVSPLNITTSSLPLGTVGVIYSATLKASGGAAPLTWSVTGSLPAGLSFNTSTAIITGTPLASGSFPLFISVLDTLLQSVQKSITLTILATPIKPTTPSKPAAAPIMAPVKQPAAAPVKPSPVKQPAVAPLKPSPVKQPAAAPVKPSPMKQPAAAPVKPSPTKPK